MEFLLLSLLLGGAGAGASGDDDLEDFLGVHNSEGEVGGAEGYLLGEEGCGVGCGCVMSAYDDY